MYQTFSHAPNENEPDPNHPNVGTERHPHEAALSQDNMHEGDRADRRIGEDQAHAAVNASGESATIAAPEVDKRSMAYI